MTTPANNTSPVFVVGSPRSGTTILGEILDRHERISQWYEPYFVWDRYFRSAPDDERTAEDATEKVGDYIRSAFHRYQYRKGCRVLVDKSPRNSLKIPFILKIFPGARFVHLLRDGRDVTLSIHREWMRRRAIVSDPDRRGRFNHVEAAAVLRGFLSRQTMLTDKLRALWFETHGHLLNRSKHLNRLRWNGRVGWGPRFRDWQHFYSRYSLLQFNAWQWRACVQCIRRDWDAIDPLNRMTLNYEDFVDRPGEAVGQLLDFIGEQSSAVFESSLPPIKAGNYRKWETGFTPDQLSELHPILTPLLLETGYAASEQWLNQN